MPHFARQRRPRRPRLGRAAVLALAAGSVAAGLAATVTRAVGPRDYPGLPNVVEYRDDFYSGGAPAGSRGFAALAELGVHTIISVDGAVPDVAAAEARGMRYVHLPIGYDGFDETRRLQLARAARDAIADGPVYVHCHHGRHRSACAAATIAVTLGWSTPDEMIAQMRISGTAPSYTGLFARVATATPVSTAALDGVPADFPSVSLPAGLVKAMVEAEVVFERLETIERAGWTTPEHHPDLVAAAEAGRLADVFRHLRHTPEIRSRPAEFGELLDETSRHADRLETLLVDGAGEDELSARLERLAASCTACHVGHRD